MTHIVDVLFPKNYGKMFETIIMIFFKHNFLSLFSSYDFFSLSVMQINLFL
jgi:hypothetical protein